MEGETVSCTGVEAVTRCAPPSPQGCSDWTMLCYIDGWHDCALSLYTTFTMYSIRDLIEAKL